MKKRILALLLSLVLVLGMLPNTVYAAETESTDSSDTITRAQWLTELTGLFDFSVDEDNYPDNYFGDVSSDSDDYYVIMLATEFGLLDIEAGENVYPDEPATREFAAQTLNYCLGFQLEDSEYTYGDVDKVTYPDDAQVAVNRGWFSLIGGNFEPDTAITASEKAVMLADAQSVWESATVDDDHDNKYEFADFVKVFPESSYAVVDENDVVTITDSSVDVEEGDTFVVWPSELPSIYVADTVTTKDGVTTITTSEADTSKAVLSVDSSGTVAMDLSQFQEEEGVTVEYARSAAKARSMASAYGVSVSQNSVVATKDITLGNGAKATITCNLSGLLLSQSVDTSKHTFFASVSGTSTITSSVSLDAVSAALGSSSVTLGSVRVAGVGKVTISAELSIKGKITATYTGDFKAGMQYSDKDGFRLVKSFTKKSFNTTAEATATVGIKVSVGLDLLVLSGNIYATTGISAKITSTNYSDGKTPKNCTQISAWLYVSVGATAKVNLEVWSKSWTKSIDVYNSTNSPVRLSFHYEDGKQVYSCARKSSSSSSSSKKGTKYVTPSDSVYGTSSYGDISSTGTDSNGNEVTIWTYTVSNDCATITGYSGSAKIVSIPSTLDGYDVTSIGGSAFADNRKIVRVVVPSGVTSIGSCAFSGCTALESLTLPESMTSIGYRVIENTAVKSITIPKNVSSSGTYGSNGALANCSTLKTVVFEDGMTSIPAYICASGSHTSYITSVTIPSTVTNIGNYAFFNCINLKLDGFSDGLETIGEYAFAYCKSLDTLSFPKSLTTLYAYAFEACKGLENLEMQDNSKAGIKVSVGTRAFENCGSLVNIKLSKNVETIGNAAFSGCTALEEINIPEGVTSISSSAFSDCTALKNVIFSEGLTSIGYCAFSGCTALESLTLPESLTSIGYRVIENTAIKSITIPKNVSSSGTYGSNGALANCSTLKTVVFEDGMTSIPAYICASGGYTSYITSVTIPSTVTNIGNYAFFNCISLKLDGFSDGLETIGEYAFAYCKSLDTLSFPKSLTTLYAYAFEACKGLENLEMQDNSKAGIKVSVGTRAFENCGSLVKIKLSKNVATIGNAAFSGCTALEEINIPEGVTSIYSDVFSGCTALKNVIFSEGLTSIGYCAFSGCTALESLTLPESLTSIGYRVIENTAIKSITIPKNVSSSGTYGSNGALANCSTLNTVVFEDGMTSIPAYICASSSYTSYITKVTIPSTVNTIGNYAFYNCTNLTTINYCGTSVDDWNKISIGSENSVLTTDLLGYHVHNYEVVEKVDATCTRGGYTVYTCAECNSTYKGDIKDALGHLEVVDEGTPATCTEKGITEGKHCSRCDLVIEEQEEIPAKGHSYVEKRTKEPDCEKEGAAKYTCSVCGDTYEETLAELGHDYSIDIVIKEATCLEEGSKQVYCSNCGDSKEEIISIADHNYVENVIAPGCTTMGNTTYTCSVCGDSYARKYTAPTGHTWNTEYTIDKEATEEEVGSKSIHCKSCDEIKPDSSVEIPVVEKSGNGSETPGSGSETPGSGSETPGSGKDTSSVDKTCTHSNTEIRNKKQATCAVTGYTGDKYCKDCGKKLSTGKTIAKTTAHTWNAGKVTKAATATKKGTKTYTCKVCGKTKTSSIAAKGAPKKGTKLTDSKTKAVYKVTKAGKTGGTVTYVKSTNKKAKTITIPATVSVEGITYKVTAVSASAFKNNTKVTKLTIGSNVSSIGKNAFYGCKKLKTITIKTQKLTSAKVGSNAFKGIYSKATVKVPKKKLNVYKKFLKKKGIGKNVKVKGF